MGEANSYKVTSEGVVIYQGKTWDEFVEFCRLNLKDVSNNAFTPTDLLSSMSWEASSNNITIRWEELPDVEAYVFNSVDHNNINMYTGKRKEY